MLVYVNDMLHLAKDTQENILKLNQVYRLKEGFSPQDICRCANVYKDQFEDIRTA